MPNFIAIGDIHGLSTALDRLLAQLPDEGELVFLGDYIDRGPDSNGVIARLLQLRETRTCHFLRGNHEAMLLQSLDGDDTMRAFWLRNGGMETVESYGGHPPAEHETFLRATTLYFDTPAYIFVHAGLLPGIPLKDNVAADYLWIRESFLRSNYDWGRLVVHGHTPTPRHRPEVRPNRINLDTGAVYGGVLTALLLPERKFIAVPGGERKRR